MAEFLVGTSTEGDYKGQYFLAETFDPETRAIRRFEYGSTYYQHRAELPPWAPDEVKALYRRVTRVRGAWEARAKDIAEARRLRLAHYSEARKLRSALTGWEYEAAAALLQKKRFRSVYLSSLADQVRTWLKEDKPTYRKPLSLKQFAALKRFSGRQGR